MAFKAGRCIGHGDGRLLNGGDTVELPRDFGVGRIEENREFRTSSKDTWKAFLPQHWDLIVAADSFTVEVWTREDSSAFSFYPSSSGRPAAFRSQAFRRSRTRFACNLTDAEDGLLKGKRYLIHDRDSLFTTEFFLLWGRRAWNL